MDAKVAQYYAHEQVAELDKTKKVFEQIKKSAKNGNINITFHKSEIEGCMPSYLRSLGYSVFIETTMDEDKYRYIVSWEQR